jgi:hypothetical protein
MYPTFRVFAIEIFSGSSEIKRRSFGVLEPYAYRFGTYHSSLESYCVKTYDKLPMLITQLLFQQNALVY